MLVADLVIGFKLIRERFTSRVTMDRPHLGIETAYADGPFKHLSNCWRFEPTPDGGCRIDFYVEFEFRSAVLQKLIGLLFHEAVKRMVGAFEILVATHGVRNLIKEGKSNQLRNMLLTGQEEGMRTLEMSLSELVTNGVVTYEEALQRSLFPKEVEKPRAVAGLAPTVAAGADA